MFFEQIFIYLRGILSKNLLRMKSGGFLNNIFYLFQTTCKKIPYHLYYLWKELIQIDIELKDRNKIKEFFQKLHNRSEDILFSIISELPEKFIPSPLMNWLSRYLDKRISQLKQQSIKMTWQNMYLQDAVDDIHSRQHGIEKAPSDDWLSSVGALLLSHSIIMWPHTNNLYCSLIFYSVNNNWLIIYLINQSMLNINPSGIIAV